MDKEKIIVIVLVILVLLAVLYSTGIINLNFGKKSGNTAGGGSSWDVPQECQKPAGQDIQSWKEHLGHHDNTKYCLDYFK
jgi:hypothetical protein